MSADCFKAKDGRSINRKDADPGIAEVEDARKRQAGLRVPR